MKVIGLTGAKRSGKDTVANYLVEHHGFVRLAFADTLKDVLTAMDPILGAYDSDNSCGDPDCCGGPYVSIREVRLSAARADYPDEDDLKASEWGGEYVTLLQNLAEGMRAIDNGTWLRPVRNALFRLRDEGVQGVVVTDVRHRNEAYLVDSVTWGETELWHVVRPSSERFRDHITEQLHGNLGEEVELLNDGTIVELGSKIEGVLNGAG